MKNKGSLSTIVDKNIY